MKVDTAYTSWISQLPAAQNSVKQKPPTTENEDIFSSSYRETKIQNLTGNQFNFSGSFVSSDREYTINDAVKKQWDVKNQVSIHDILNGAQLRLTSTDNSSEMLALQENLQKNGISSGVNWHGLKGDLITLGIRSNNLSKLSNQIDYIASRYSVLQSKIQSEYSGDEQKNQLEKLDDVFNQAKNKFADSYSQVVGGFFEQNGVSGETDKIKNSVLSILEDRQKTYTALLKNNPDYATVADPKDKWILQDDAYLAQELRKAENTHSASTEQKTSETYSLDDLEGAGKYIQEIMSDPVQISSALYDEESLGVNLAVRAMKTDFFTRNVSISKEMSQAISQSFQGYMENYLNRWDQGLKEQEEESNRFGAKNNYPPLDRKAVYNTFQYTMEAYKRTGNIEAALKDGTQYSKKIFDQKVQNKNYQGIVRYSVSTWSNFYSDKNNLSTANMKQYQNDINHFVASVLKGDLSKIEFNSDTAKNTQKFVAYA